MGPHPSQLKPPVPGRGTQQCSAVCLSQGCDQRGSSAGKGSHLGHTKLPVLQRRSGPVGLGWKRMQRAPKYSSCPRGVHVSSGHFFPPWGHTRSLPFAMLVEETLFSTTVFIRAAVGFRKTAQEVQNAQPPLTPCTRLPGWHQPDTAGHAPSTALPFPFSCPVFRQSPRGALQDLRHRCTSLVSVQMRRVTSLPRLSRAFRSCSSSPR